MNLPNKLTLCRMICIPFLVAAMYINASWAGIVAIILFCFASFTDYLDGHIARKNGIVTDFGKFLDPIADKLLVLSTLIMLIHKGQMPAWIVILILARELSVDGLRLIAATKGTVISAGPLGKLKTVSQMILILWLMISGTSLFSTWPGILSGIWTSLITLWSGVDYFLRNSTVISTK